MKEHKQIINEHIKRDDNKTLLSFYVYLNKNFSNINDLDFEDLNNIEKEILKRMECSNED